MTISIYLLLINDDNVETNQFIFDLVFTIFFSFLTLVNNLNKTPRNAERGLRFSSDIFAFHIYNYCSSKRITINWYVSQQTRCFVLFLCKSHTIIIPSSRCGFVPWRPRVYREIDPHGVRMYQNRLSGSAADVNISTYSNSRVHETMDAFKNKNPRNRHSDRECVRTDL